MGLAQKYDQLKARVAELERQNASLAEQMDELRFENADLFARREGLKFLCKQLMREAWKCPSRRSAHARSAWRQLRALAAEIQHQEMLRAGYELADSDDDPAEPGRR